MSDKRALLIFVWVELVVAMVAATFISESYIPFALLALFGAGALFGAHWNDADREDKLKSSDEAASVPPPVAPGR